MKKNVHARVGALLAVAGGLGCQSTYFSLMEKLGVEKREILVGRVEDARDSQERAREQFESALDRFRSVVDFDGGALEDLYDDLSRELERSEKRAEDVTQRIDDVEEVADALFEEWEDELDDYSSKERRRDSEELLEETRDRYDELLVVMRRAESSMEPVLATFRDQVLVLKHNLNARAVAGLRSELDAIERDVAQLIEDMDLAIAEATLFIDSMSAGAP